MDNNYSQKKLLFLYFIPILLFLVPAVTEGQTETAREIEESEEFENSLVRNVQNDYRNGFRELLKFINFLNDTLTALNEKLATQDTTQSAKAEKISRKTNLLLRHAFPNINTWEGFESLIRAQAKVIKTGKTFNGSTLSDIKSRAALVGYNGRHTAIVFVNHLDEAIGDFTIYQERNNFLYNPAPNSVPGRTQEVFTFVTSIHFYEGGAFTSFSYEIPSLNIRVAAISYGGTYGVGLAFVPEGADMKTYYESQKGIEGSTVWECCNYMDRNLSVGYKNLYARIFADYEGNYKSTLRIELIKLPLDE